MDYILNVNLVQVKRRKYIVENKDKISIYDKKWKKDNPDKLKISRDKWAKDNSDKLRSKSRKRRAQKLKVGENYSIQDEVITRNAFENKCANCRSEKNLHIDHHMPLSKGYALSLGNAVLLCSKCNISKSSKLPNKFYDDGKLNIIKKVLKNLLK